MTPGTIRLRSFGRGSAPDCYAAYRRITFEVFVAEQGWPLADPEVPGLAAEDPFDAGAQFWLAESETGTPIGAVRALAVREEFPHAGLFWRHLDHEVFARAVPYMGTLNALAVLPEHRRRPCHVAGSGWVGTVGQLLVLAGLRGLQQQGLRAVVATAGGAISTRLFSRAGFHVIDPPERTDLHPDLVLTNVGMVLGSQEHRLAQARGRVQPVVTTPFPLEIWHLDAYFREQEALIRENSAAAHAIAG